MLINKMQTAVRILFGRRLCRYLAETDFLADFI